MTKRILLGTDDFAELAGNDYLFVDKSLLIKDVIDGAKVNLITRPRRWGKTLNMIMLQHFFAAEVGGQPTRKLFENLKIAKIDNGKYLQYQGQYPVIFVSFKDVQEDSYEDAEAKVCCILQALFDQHFTLQNSPKLTPLLKRDFEQILLGEATKAQFELSLLTLSKCLSMHYSKKVYILIDEYDKPLNDAHISGYFKALTNFMSNLFGACLKTNPYLEKGVLTGILRIAKANLFSGLNNIKEHTLLDNQYQAHFGFSENEVVTLFKTQNLEHDIEGVKTWYNGYKFGDSVIYNPWSIMSCLDSDGQLGPYWIDTANNNLIKMVIANTDYIKQTMKHLLQNRAVSVEIDKHISLEQLFSNTTSIWSLFFNSGYLTVESKTMNDANLFDCQVKIPNREIRGLYIRYLKEWFAEKIGVYRYQSFLTHLISGDVEAFTRDLSSYLKQTASVHDTAEDKAESFYHGFVVAMIASLRSSHIIESNRESGYGRPDLLLIPQDQKQSKGIILEFKHAKDKADIAKAAKTALEQIDLKAYQSSLEAHQHIKEIIKVGLAFSKKAVQSAYKIFNTNTLSESEIKLTDEI